MAEVEGGDYILGGAIIRMVLTLSDRPAFRNRFSGSLRRPMGQACDHAGVKATGEDDAERYVGHQAVLDRFAQAVQQRCSIIRWIPTR